MKKTWVIVVNVVLIAAILGFVAFYANYEGKTYYRSRWRPSRAPRRPWSR